MRRARRSPFRHWSPYERGLHCRYRHPSLWPQRWPLGPRSGGLRGAPGFGRHRARMAGNRICLWRLGGLGQCRLDGQRTGADRGADHQCVQRLRHRRLGAGLGLFGDCQRRVRARHGGWLRQASARRFQCHAGRLWPARLVWRNRADDHHAVFRHQNPALYGAPRHQPDYAGAGGGKGLSKRRAVRSCVAALAG